MKHAQVFDIGMIFVVLGAMVAIALVGESLAEQVEPVRGLGQRAFELQKAYQTGDLVADYAAMSARWSAAAAVLELGLAGGFPWSKPCGVQQGYARWNTPDGQTTCEPNAYQSFYYLLEEKMEKDMNLLVEDLTATLPAKVPYEFLVTGNRLLGIAAAPVAITLRSPHEKVVSQSTAALILSYRTVRELDPSAVGTYVFRPDFEIPFTYDLEVYKALFATVQEMLNDCTALASPEDTALCAKKKIDDALAAGKMQATVTISRDNETYFFTITQDARKTLYFTDQLPTIKFALSIP